MIRLIAPAGTKLTGGQIRRVLSLRERPDGERPDPVREVAARLGSAYAFGTGSGKAGLYAVFKALRSLRPGRDVVAVPGYTCFSVPAAAVRAGLKVHPVDLDPSTLDFDRGSLERVAGDRLLCVVATNLFGLMNDEAPISRVAGAAGAFFVDDAAQAFGSTMRGTAAGARGDAGILSMGRGKPLFGMGGGLVVTGSDGIAAAVGEVVAGFPEGSKGRARMLLELAAYSVFFNPLLYRVADSLPFLQLGVTIYDPSFPADRLGKAACGLLGEVLRSVDDTNAGRRRTARAIREAIGGLPRFALPEPPPECDPVFTRVPVLAEDEGLRDRAVLRLRRRGIVGPPMYPSAVCDIPGIEPHMVNDTFHCPAAEDVARRLFTLPTHAHVTDRDVREIAAALAAC